MNMPTTLAFAAAEGSGVAPPSDNLGLILNILAIVLSLVALAITVFGFFASLRFYQSGMELQGVAQEALGRIAARTDTIENRVGGLTDTLVQGLVSSIGSGQTAPAGPIAPQEEGTAASGPRESDTLTRQLAEYWGFKGLQLSDVSGGIAQVLYNLGRYFGFLLLDDGHRFVYFRNFAYLRPEIAIASVDFLLRNIVNAYAKVEAAPEAPERTQVMGYFSRIRVTILVDDGTNPGRVRDLVDRKRVQMSGPAADIGVDVIRPKDVEHFLAEQYDVIGYEEKG